jgi:hypothetical protein
MKCFLLAHRQDMLLPQLSKKECQVQSSSDNNNTAASVQGADSDELWMETKSWWRLILLWQRVLCRWNPVEWKSTSAGICKASSTYTTTGPIQRQSRRQETSALQWSRPGGEAWQLTVTSYTSWLWMTVNCKVQDTPCNHVTSWESHGCRPVMVTVTVSFTVLWQ